MLKFTKTTGLMVAGGLMLIALSAYAKTQFFNADGTLVMKSVQQKPKLYQIWNTSGQKIALDVVNKASGAQAGYASMFDPHNGSAFVYSGVQPPLIWVCTVPAVASKAAQKMACNTVLKVTNYPTRLLQLKSSDGNYWLFENKPTAEFKSTLKASLASRHLNK